MHQTHLYLVTPPKHQPEWPEIEPVCRFRKIDVMPTWACVLGFAVMIAVGIASTLKLLGWL